MLLLHISQGEESGNKMRIPDKLAEEVKALRSTTDKKGRKMPLAKVCSKTGLTMRKVKYILFEHNNLRIKDLKQSYYIKTYVKLQSINQKSDSTSFSPKIIEKSARIYI